MARRQLPASEKKLGPEEGKKKNVPPRSGFGITHAREGADRYSLEETRRHMGVVEALMVRGMSSAKIFEQLKSSPNEEMRLRRKRVLKLVEKIRERWMTEDSAMRAEWKASQIRRLHNWISRAIGEDAKYDAQGNLVRKEVKINHSAIGKYETILADIQGTRAPIEIDVRIEQTEAVASVILNMSGDELEEAVREQLEVERRSNAYLSLPEVKKSA